VGCCGSRWRNDHEDQGAGLGLGGDSDPTYVVLKAEGTDTSLKLTNKDGRQQLIKP